MKKIIILLTIIAISSCFGCAKTPKNTETTVPEQTSLVEDVTSISPTEKITEEVTEEVTEEPSIFEDPTESQTSSQKNEDTLYDATSYLVNVGWSDNVEFVQNCQNKMAILSDTEDHLPTYDIQSKSALDKFRKDYADDFNWDDFDDLVAKYDETYFVNNHLVIAYKVANSGSLNFELADITSDGKTFKLIIKQTNHPEVYTTDMAGWFVVVELKNVQYPTTYGYDAQFIFE